MEAYGYTPNQIADMSLEQMLLGYKKTTGQEATIRCKNLSEARRILQQLGRPQ